tara:strand:+ start:4792 stop:5580 length:789 start_codon:yes stop_codon:yes gene_type:complete
VTLIKSELLKDCLNKEVMKILLEQAETVITTWQTLWSPFLSAPVKEEAIKKFKFLHELRCYSEGGYPNAERERICFMRNNEQPIFEKISAPIKGMKLEGNFLFDRADTIDFKKSLKEMGISSKDLGDLWITKDRGAQLLCTEQLAQELNGENGMVREVKINFKCVEITELSLPIYRQPKTITTVEASKRIDAIASAGFGISRTKSLSHIKGGRLRLNWKPVKQGSKLISTGDRIQLEGKGHLEVLNVELTKRGRWKVELLRQ